jgi:ribosome maturation protein SDO1
MPVGIIQPSNRINLTNVSLVRYKKGKKRFELACYKNKLLEYRSGIETNLDDVLQVPTIFLSVSKGATAPKEDLEKSFGKKASTPEGHDEIIKEILSKGEIQVGAKERGELLERIEREVLEEVAGRLVDPGTKRVYTTGMISKALDVLSKEGGHAPKQDSLPERLAKVNLGEVAGKGKSNGDISTGETGTPTTDGEVERGGGRHDKKHKKSDMPMWTGVVTTKSAKSQALDAMRALIAWQPIPVMRARMRLRVTCPTSIAKQTPKSKAAVATEGEGNDAPAEQQGRGTVKDRILAFVEQVESQDTTGEEWEVVGFVEPGAFKGLGEFVAGETKGRGRVEVLDMAVTHEDEA